MVVKGNGHGGPGFTTPENRKRIEDFLARHLGKRPVPKGQRVFTCGHSFHVFVYPILAEMAKSAGIHDHQGVGLSSIGGSRVIQHWDVPEEKNQAKAALRAGKVDVLTLSPIWMPDEGIEKFARLGVEHNPHIRVTVQEFWLPNDTYEPSYPLDVGKKVDHNATVIAELRKQQARYDRDLGDFVRSVNRAAGQGRGAHRAGRASRHCAAGEDRRRRGARSEGAMGPLQRLLGPSPTAPASAGGLLPFCRDLSAQPGGLAVARRTGKRPQPG